MIPSAGERRPEGASWGPEEPPATAEATPERTRHRWLTRTTLLRIALLLGLVALIVWVNESAVDSAGIRGAVREFGYLGLFGTAALSGFNLVVPVPVVAFFPFFMEAGLAPVPTVLTIGLGMTAGDMVGYLLGAIGRQTVEPPRVVRGIIQRAQRLRDRHRLLPYAVLLGYAAVVPLPNELIVIPMAFMGFALAGIFAAALLGNLVFNTIAATGVVQLFHLF